MKTLVLLTTLGFGQTSPITRNQRYILYLYVFILFVFCNMFVNMLAGGHP